MKFLYRYQMKPEWEKEANISFLIMFLTIFSMTMHWWIPTIIGTSVLMGLLLSRIIDDYQRYG